MVCPRLCYMGCYWVHYHFSIIISALSLENGRMVGTFGVTGARLTIHIAILTYTLGEGIRDKGEEELWLVKRRYVCEWGMMTGFVRK